MKRSARRSNGYELVVEVETGKGVDALEGRPVLAAALAAARRAHYPVIVAKLDRLSRDVHFISGLMVHKVPFIVAESAPTPIRSRSTSTPPPSPRWSGGGSASAPRMRSLPRRRAARCSAIGRTRRRRGN